MITIDEERTLLERILTSDVIGFVMQGENGALMQYIDADPELRSALSEWKTQRIREMDLFQRQAELVADPNGVVHFSLNGSDGQAGDDHAFSQAMSELAWQANNAGRDHSATVTPPAFPGS